MVQAGTLPPVAQRVPAEPLVMKPLRSTGKYGGTWRRGFIGPGDSENGNRLRSGDKLIFFDATGTELRPNVAKGWEVSADGKRTTVFLRRGHEMVGRVGRSPPTTSCSGSRTCTGTRTSPRPRPPKCPSRASPAGS